MNRIEFYLTINCDWSKIKSFCFGIENNLFNNMWNSCEERSATYLDLRSTSKIAAGFSSTATCARPAPWQVYLPVEGVRFLIELVTITASAVIERNVSRKNFGQSRPKGWQLLHQFNMGGQVQDRIIQAFHNKVKLRISPVWKGSLVLGH